MRRVPQSPENDKTIAAWNSQNDGKHHVSKTGENLGQAPHVATVIIGNGPNTVLESTVSNPELSEFWPSRSSGERTQ